jgi:hypothetical protein
MITHEGPQVQAPSAHEPHDTAPALLTAALAYGARGWCVMPIHEVTAGICTCAKGDACGKDTGKHPRIKDWTTEASTDPDQLASWWHEWPRANVGVVTGIRSQLAVLDVDPRNGKPGQHLRDLPRFW